MTAECTHTPKMPSPASCVECMQDIGLGAPPEEPVTVEFVFAAKFESHCDGCNLPIYLGQRVARLSNRQYVHDGCEP